MLGGLSRRKHTHIYQLIYLHTDTAVHLTDWNDEKWWIVDAAQVSQHSK